MHRRGFLARLASGSFGLAVGLAVAILVSGCTREQPPNEPPVEAGARAREQPPAEPDEPSPLRRKIVAMLAEPADWIFEDAGSGRIVHKDGVVAIYSSGWTWLRLGDNREAVKWADGRDEQRIGDAAKPVFDATRKRMESDRHWLRREWEREAARVLSKQPAR